ncbi:MAG: transposase domain-containing protein, partial [Singulisphaera sp.]|nr:transposase domain-containing protein [Singulisphaera sp.]
VPLSGRARDCGDHGRGDQGGGSDDAPRRDRSRQRPWWSDGSHIDPFAYLTDILRRLPSHPAQQLDELLPDVWFTSHPSARRKKAA